MAHVFTILSVVRGYHKYKDVWSAPIDGTELSCEREPGNPRDTSAVAVVERSPSGKVTVGHVPQLFSAICSIFIHRGGSLVCVVTGARQYSMDLPQGAWKFGVVIFSKQITRRKVIKQESYSKIYLKLRLNQQH